LPEEGKVWNKYRRRDKHHAVVIPLKSIRHRRVLFRGFPGNPSPKVAITIWRMVSVSASCLIVHSARIPAPRAQPARPTANSQVTTFEAQQIDALLAPVAP
jgi:hypothetical protein